MSHRMPQRESAAGEAKWARLYRIGGISTLLMVAVVPVQIAVFAIQPPPDTALGWFELFGKNPLLGLLSFEFLFLVYGILAVPHSLALYFAVRKTDPDLAVISIALSLLATVAVFTARPAFEMLYLSGEYAAASTEDQRAVFLAAGESMLAVWHGTAYWVCYFLGSINGLILSIVMLKSRLFGKTIPSVRMLSSVLDFTLFIPVVGLFLSICSALALMVYNILVGRQLLQFAGGISLYAKPEEADGE
ncbi:MAG: DUF4386 family protein [Anaerolineales bacterium]|nr:DUF4386 family protein [Anaerolineales bacterium]